PDIIFITDEKDALLCHIENQKPIFVTNQTTLSIYDIESILSILKTKYPNLLFDDDICDATKVRQQAVMDQEKVDLMLVVGDPMSSNSNKLASVGKKSKGVTSYLIQSVEDIQIEWLKPIDSVSVTSGASTPTVITEEVISYLKQFNKNDPKTWDHSSKISLSDIL
ncbi:MAG: hypothetical protein V3569_01265, partial [Acholeplasmataceae bacterium]